MNCVYFTIHLGKNPPPQNSCQLKFRPFFIFFKKHRFHILHFPISTRLFTKPTGHHYTTTKYQFSPDIGLTTVTSYSSYPLSDTLCTVQHVFAATDEMRFYARGGELMMCSAKCCRKDRIYMHSKRAMPD